MYGWGSEVAGRATRSGALTTRDLAQLRARAAHAASPEALADTIWAFWARGSAPALADHPDVRVYTPDDMFDSGQGADGLSPSTG